MNVEYVLHMESGRWAKAQTVCPFRIVKTKDTPAPEHRLAPCYVTMYAPTQTQTDAQAAGRADRKIFFIAGTIRSLFVW